MPDTKYLIFDSEDDAKARSAEAWEQVLGRKKNPDDVTEYLWGWDTGADGKAALVINEKEELLKSEETSLVEVELPTGKGENWEKPEGLVDTGEIEVPK